MERIIDKGIIAACCLTAFITLPPDPLPICGFLIAVALSAASEVLPRFARLALVAAYAVASLFVPAWAAFLPLLAYECATDDFVFTNALWAVPLFASLRAWDTIPWLAVLLFCVVAAVLAWRTSSFLEQREHFQKLRDETREASLELEERNRGLEEARDLSAQVATLAERGRIARDIHDNVGHLLTRAIMQVEAFKVVHAAEPQVAGEFDAVAGTLNEAMETVRASVHDLRDEALDPEGLMRSALDGCGIGDTRLDFAAGSLPADVGRCFVAIVREAATNTVRHSDATFLQVRVYELPGLYQVTVRDNGTEPPRADGEGSGMGLAAMEDRVRALGGTFRAGWENGFRVFASVPKTEGEEQ